MYSLITWLYNISEIVNTFFDFFAGYNKPLCALSTAISKSKLNYKFETLQNATKNFDPTNKIGQGGFGSVYKVISIFILYDWVFKYLDKSTSSLNKI